jgi:predicted GTPase
MGELLAKPQPSYVSFLKNKIRDEFALDMIPVRLDLKASRKDWNSRIKK